MTPDSYLLPPPIFVTMYLWHQRRAGPQTVRADQPLPSWLRWLFLICGGSLTAGAILAFIVPTLLIPIFPWQLTPLTARSLCGWLIAVGTILLSMARENDRARVRLGTPILILLLPTLVIQMARYAEEVNWTSPTLWLSLILFAVIGSCGLYLAVGNWRESLS